MSQENTNHSISKTNNIVYDDDASLCGIKPVNFAVSTLIGSTFISIIWSFYSVAIEIIPMQEHFLNCPYIIAYNWSPGNNSICKSFLETQRSYIVANSTFWSLMVIAGLTPWVVISLIAVITTHDKVIKKYKEWWWCLLGLLLIIYFGILLIASFSGISIYGSPAFIGVPMIIIIPSLVVFMKQINICKRIVCFINIPITICYIMVTSSLVILSSYIVWTPASYYDLHYKAKILIGCAYYYAFLASLILTYELDYVYKFDGYAEIGDSELQTISDIENKRDPSQQENIKINQITIIDNKCTNQQKKPVLLVQILSGATILVTTSVLSITTSYANICILALIAIFPFLAFGLINLQNPFNQYIVSLHKN